MLQTQIIQIFVLSNIVIHNGGRKYVVFRLILNKNAL